ncbi:hypothetical protein [Hydrogenivirga sp.]
MIRINLIKKEKKGFALPSVSLAKLKEYDIKELAKDKAVLIVPAVGVILLAGELFYAFQLKQEVESLQREVNSLNAQRNKLKKRADIVQARKRALQNEISNVKRRIRQLELGKDIIIVLKGYYEPFNESLSYLYSYVPSTVWFNSLSQSMDFQRVNVELSFGSYDINSIKNFFTIVKREFPQLTPNEIKKQENKSGIIYYVSSIKFRKDFVSGGE